MNKHTFIKAMKICDNLSYQFWNAAYDHLQEGYEPDDFLAYCGGGEL